MLQQLLDDARIGSLGERPQELGVERFVSSAVHARDAAERHRGLEVRVEQDDRDALLLGQPQDGVQLLRYATLHVGVHEDAVGFGLDDLHELFRAVAGMETHDSQVLLCQQDGVNGCSAALLRRFKLDAEVHAAQCVGLVRFEHVERRAR